MLARGLPRATSLLAALLLTGCARYARHDPGSHCLERQAELRLRPATDCEKQSSDPRPECKWAMTLELHWKCKKWSSW